MNDGEPLPRSGDASRAGPVLPPLAAHACWLLYPIDDAGWPPDAGPSFGDLADAQASARLDAQADQGGDAERWLPEDALASIAGAHRDKPLWQPGSLEPGSDLYPYVRRLLGEGAAAAATTEVFAQVLRLTDNARDLLHGKAPFRPAGAVAATGPRRLRLLLGGTAARRRIARRVPSFGDDALLLSVTALLQVRFCTGHGLLLARLELARADGAALDPYLLVEGLYRLARFNRVTWADVTGTPVAAAPVFSLGALLRGLAGDHGADQRAERVFTASLVQFDASPTPAALERLLVQLARHYTDDYRLADTPACALAVSHFDNVWHRFALEGCATAVDLGGYAVDDAADGPPASLAQFESQTFRRHYLPIMLLAYHEFRFLLHATDAASIWPEPDAETDARRAERIARLERVRLGVTRFMLGFRFTRVSRIGMHNDVNAALRAALGLDPMLAELDRDSAQIDAYLKHAAAQREEARDARRERRWRWASALGVFGIAWLTTFTIAKELLALEWVRQAVTLSHDQTALIEVGAAGIVALIAATLTGWIGRGGG